MPRRTDPLLTLPDREGILHVRIYQKMRALILDGSWPAGMRLPSSRSLAADLSVSRNTVSLAFDQLVADGWVEARARSGTFVSSSVRSHRDQHWSGSSRSGRPPVPFELSPGAMDAFPFKRWAKLQSKVWAQSFPNLLYEHDRAGDRGLREAIASVVGPSRGMHIDPDDLIITTGTQNALDLVAAAIGPATAIVEDPGYVAGQAVLRARGMTVVPETVDARGLDVASARARTPSPALVVTTPNLQFPTCVTMSPERRSDLIDWAQEEGAWIFEDDYDSDARFDGSRAPTPLREIGGDLVIASVTLNRLLFRSLRLGFMVVPEAYRERLLAVRTATDEYVNLPNQLVLKEFIEEGGFTAHLRASRKLHAERREALICMLQPYLGELFDRDLNGSGLHLVLKPLRHDAATIVRKLRAAGVASTTLAEQSRRSDAPEGVLLGFAAFSPDVIAAMGPAVTRSLETLT